MGPGYEQPAAGDSPRTREPEQSPTWPRDDIYGLVEKAMYGPEKASLRSPSVIPHRGPGWKSSKIGLGFSE